MSDFNYWKTKEKWGDVLSKLQEHINRGGLTLRPDGKIEVASNNKLAVDTPWVFIRKDPEHECFKWHRCFFDMLDMLPSQCLQCWKVVAKPRTLREHFQLFDLMKELDRPSKLGIELRSRVHALYGAYFYNHSVWEGKRCYDIVRGAVDQHISPDIPVILKRGCTEFEDKFGPSDKWDSLVTEEQRELETVLEDVIVEPDNELEPEILREHIKTEWVKWAYGNADSTYLDFTDGKPLHTPYVTYHDKEIREEGA